MKKLVSWILITAFVLALMPMAVGGIADVYPEDENITAKDYAEDTIIFSETSGMTSASSGVTWRWNRFYPGRGADTVTDPKDASNKVGYAYAGYSNGNAVCLTKNAGVPTEGVFAWESRLMIAPPKEGAYPEQIYFHFLGIKFATFTRTEGTTYTYTIGSEGAIGTVQAEEWVRLTAYVECGNEGRVSNDTVTHLTAVLPDGTTIRDTVVGLTSNGNIDYGIVMGSDSVGGVYLDDVYLYIPGDFGPTTMTTDATTDIYENYPLSGQLTFTLYHRPDAISVTPSRLKLYREDGSLVPITNITWDPTRPDHVILDFSAHPLVENTTYTLVFPERTIDVAGNLMQETEITFRTRGESGDRREPIELVRETAGGYVMPDPYNTGYRCEEEELVDFYEKYPDFSAGSEIIITEEIARKYNYEFSHFILTQGNIKVTATSPIYIHDAKFSDGGVGNGRSGRVGESSRITIAYCEFTGGGDTFGGKNLTISHCYVHDIQADHMKGSSGQIVAFNYFRDGGTRNPSAHADVIQFMGSTTEVQNDIRIYGNRFDVPALGYEHVSNCCFFMKPEGNTKGYSNVQAIGNWMNGGGFTIYFTPAGGAQQLHYITYKDNKIGCGYTYGVLYDTVGVDTIDEDILVYEGNQLMSTLEAGSIVYYNADGKRVYDISEMSGGGSVLVNMANYVNEAKQYRIDIEVVDATGRVIGTFTKEGEVRRYIPVSEYFTEENQVITGTFTDAAGTHNIVELINLPDHPHDVADTLTLTGLPQNMAGCRIEVTVADTTHEETVIRTGALADEVIENHRMPGVTYPEEPAYAYAEGFYSSDWAGMTTAAVLAEAGITWDADMMAHVAISEDGVITFTDMERDDIRLSLTGKLSAGAARLAFDFYHDGEHADGALKLTVGGRTVFSVAEDGTLRVGEHTVHIADGWNTAEVIFLPIDREGHLCVADDLIAHNEVYVRVTAQGTDPATYGITASMMEEDYLFAADFAARCYLSDVGAAFGYESGNTPVRIANLAAADLVAEADLYTITLKMNGVDKTAYMPVDYAGHGYPLPQSAGRWLSVTADGLTLLSETGVVDITDSVTLVNAAYEQLAFAGATILLGSEMTLNMKVSEDELPFVIDSLCVVAENTAESWAQSGERDEDGYISIPLQGIRAANMAKDMELYVVVEKDGVYYISETATTYSVLRYIERVYQKPETTEDVKQVLIAMLGYGAEAESRLYGTSEVERCAEGLGVTLPDTLPVQYTSDAMTEADKTAINTVADVGAYLNEGIDIIFAVKDAEITALRVTCGAWSETYSVVDGRIVVGGMHAAMLLSEYTLEFMKGDVAVLTAVFVIGNFLDGRMQNAEEASLARATIIYMAAARRYALSLL